MAFLENDYPKEIIRAKGYVWFYDDDIHVQLFEQAGRNVSVTIVSNWVAAFGKKEREREIREHPEILEDWDEKDIFCKCFLEAGKTTFVKELLSQDYFDTGEKTLVLLCEDGTEEYTDDFYREHHLTVEMIEDEEEFTEEKLKEVEEKTNPERIIIEFNGMWNPEHKLDYWSGEQIMMIVIIDASTFELYLNNMKPYVKQQIANAYMPVFRSCDGKENRLASYRRSIRALNPQTNF